MEGRLVNGREEIVIQAAKGRLWQVKPHPRESQIDQDVEGVEYAQAARSMGGISTLLNESV
jgi:hypothetical protein